MRKSPTRKPVHLQMIGGKEPRQIMWEKIRALRQFTFPQLVGELSGAIHRVSTHVYVKALTAGGFLSRDDNNVYTLIKDQGVEAPRLKKDGTPVTTGYGTENMWRTLRQLGRPVTVKELVAFASTETIQITEAYALDYLKNLTYAGYVSRENGRYMLKASKNTGPRPPMIQKCAQIFDPNLGEVVWSKVNG
jgi:hypothetical protein